MDRQKIMLAKQTKDYLSSLKIKMKELSKTMEGRIIHVKDENNFVDITINGKQKILSLTISDGLMEWKAKKEIIIVLTTSINRAIQQTNRINMEEVLNTISLTEYANIISREQQDVVDSIKEVEKGVGRFAQEPLLLRKNAVSKSGNIKIGMSGANILQTMEIRGDYFTSKNKEKVAEEIIEVVNAVTQENQKEITKRIEKTDREINERISED